MTLLLQGAGVQVISVGSADPIGDTLRSDAIAYWTMDETSGTRIDATGRNNNLTDFSSNIGAINGKISNAAQFGFEDVNYKYLYHNSNSDFEIAVNGQSYHFALWAKLNATQMAAGFGISGNILYKGDIGDDTQDFRLQYYLPSTRFTFADYNSNAAEWVITIDDSTWYFIECRYNHVTAKVGLAINNGAFVEADSYSFDYPVSQSPFYIGNDEANNSIWYGAIDEVLFVKRLLSQPERDYLWNGGAGRALFPAP